MRAVTVTKVEPSILNKRRCCALCYIPWDELRRAQEWLVSYRYCTAASTRVVLPQQKVISRQYLRKADVVLTSPPQARLPPSQESLSFLTYEPQMHAQTDSQVSPMHMKSLTPNPCVRHASPHTKQNVCAHAEESASPAPLFHALLAGAMEQQILACDNTAYPDRSTYQDQDHSYLPSPQKWAPRNNLKQE